jgi:uncharacterized membrane protein (DUF4010 family)
MVFGAASGAAMVIAMWLFHSEHSPVYEYAIWHTSIGNVLTQINLPALVVGIATSGNVHQPSQAATYAVIFGQWAVLGSVGAWLISRWHASRQRDQGDA